MLTFLKRCSWQVWVSGLVKKMEDRLVVVMFFLLCRAALIHDVKKIPLQWFLVNFPKSTVSFKHWIYLNFECIWTETQINKLKRAVKGHILSVRSTLDHICPVALNLSTCFPQDMDMRTCSIRSVIGHKRSLPFTRSELSPIEPICEYR